MKQAILISTGLLLTTPFIHAEKNKDKKPNVVFILADDLGYGDLSCYGQEKFETPNIDKLAQSGMRFTQCYSGTTVSAPSRSCLLTGTHSGHTPVRGNLELDPEGQFPLPDDARTIFRRRKIGFVFQSYNLVPVLSVYENIVFPIQLDGGKIDKNYIDSIIETLGLKEKIHAMPNQLSGGQQQRVAIARALATKPAIILADEPTGNLDSKTSQDVLSLLKITGKKYNQTIVMITHDEAIAQMSDRIIRIEDGNIVKGGD